MHRCGTFGDQTSMPDTDKWFEMITQLQNGFKEVVCDRTAKGKKTCNMAKITVPKTKQNESTTEQQQLSR